MSESLLPLTDFITRFQLQLPVNDAPVNAGRRAAVLIPIVNRPQPGLLLTRRSASLRKHAGQVAFPGGMEDASDASLVATALREAEEEIALPRQQVRVLGQLPPVASSTGFQVTPVVGIIPPDLALRASPDEVESLFEMPLALALETARYSALDVQRHGLAHRVWLSWFNHYFIWGMTAGIIRELSLQVLPAQIS